MIAIDAIVKGADESIHFIGSPLIGSDPNCLLIGPFNESRGIILKNPIETSHTVHQSYAKRVVSPEARTRTSGPTITALLRTLTPVNASHISFAQKMKKHGYFYFSSSTK